MERHREAEGLIRNWMTRVRSTAWRHPHDAKRLMSNVRNIGDRRLIFKIGWNRYRIVALADYANQSIQIRFVGTHAEYNKINSEEV